MILTKRLISVSQLKARLSEHLRAVKAGETVLITDRGRPIVVMSPLPPEVMSEELDDLVEAGLVHPRSGELPPDYWDMDQPQDPEGAVRQAIIEEREEGR